MPEKNKKISSATGMLMVSIALFFDSFQGLIEIIPVLGQIFSSLITIFAGLTFYLWFKINGVDFVNPKRAGYLGGGFLIELIPFLNILPAWTLTVILLVSNSNRKKFSESDIMSKRM